MVDADGTDLSFPQLGVGSIIDGKYRVESLVGEGGMGVVWKATQLDLEREVAIKVVREEFTRNEEVVARTLQEARAVARLRGEHVVRVLDVGRLMSGAPYIVMEFLEGRDVFSDLEERLLPMPVTVAVDLVLEACEGLAEAHSRGIVHRDLKPENLFLAEQPDGSVVLKILDFGISKAGPRDARRKAASNGPSVGERSTTNPAMALGSPEYMAPEQMRGANDVDARADIWSLGAVLYELLAGTAPFQAASMPALCSMVLEQEPPRLRNLRPELPFALECVVAKCMRKDRNERYKSVDSLARDLAPFGSPSAEVRADRIARVISGIRPRWSSSDERMWDSPTLRNESVKTLNSLDGTEAPIAPRGRRRRSRWPVVWALCLGVGVAVGFAGARGYLSLERDWLWSAVVPISTEKPRMGTTAPPPVDSPQLLEEEPPLPSQETTAAAAEPQLAATVVAPRAAGSGTRRSTPRAAASAEKASEKAEPAERTEPKPPVVSSDVLDAYPDGETRRDARAVRDAWDPSSFGGRR